MNTRVEQDYLADLGEVCRYYDKVWIPDFAKSLPPDKQDQFRFTILGASQADFIADEMEQVRISKLDSNDPKTEVVSREYLYRRLRRYVVPSEYFQPLWSAEVVLGDADFEIPWGPDHPLQADGLNRLPRGLLFELSGALNLALMSGGRLIKSPLSEGEHSAEVAAPKS